MTLVRAIFSHWLARQIAQHGSVGALAIGLGAHLLGIPLAAPQISALLYAVSIVGYILSQLKALRNPPPATPPTVSIPTTLGKVGTLLAVALLASSAFTRPAAAESHVITFTPPTQREDGSPFDPSKELASTRLQCGIGPASPVPWVINDTIPAPTTSKTYDFPTAGTWNCHAWVIATDGTQSGDTPDLVFTIPFVVPAPPATITANPKPPALGIK